ncbi:MAG: hypothetical protein WBY28_09730 [Nitrososphaeraceae archaeon]
MRHPKSKQFEISLLVPLGYRSETMVRREKEQLIRKLLKEHSDWEYIRKVARCSPNTIQKVKEKNEQIRAPKLKSKRSEALRMYDKGYSSFDVVVKLDISADEAESYKIEYWKLKNMDAFEAIYIKYKNALPNLIGKIHEMTDLNISMDQIAEGLRLVGHIPRLQNQHEELAKRIRVTNEDYNQLQVQLSNLKSEARRTRIHNRKYKIHYKCYMDELKLETESILSGFEKIKNSIENKEAFQSIWKSINEILGDKNQLLWAAASSIFRAAENNPNLKAAFSDLLGMDKAISIKLYDFHATIKPELIRAADIIYDEIFNRLVEMAAARL